MPKKTRVKDFPLPQDVGNDFEESDSILNFKPTIEFVHPESQEDDGTFDPDSETIQEIDTIDSLRKRTEDAIKGYESVKKLAVLAKKRVDARVAAAVGEEGFAVNLDPSKSANDALVVAAIKRCFPEQEDPTKITYDIYKKCLENLRKSDQLPKAQDLMVKDEDIRAAKADPLRTDFGGLGAAPGLNRPEISSPARIVNPIDLDAFQASAIITLFKLLLPLIMPLIPVP